MLSTLRSNVTVSRSQLPQPCSPNSSTRAFSKYVRMVWIHRTDLHQHPLQSFVSLSFSQIPLEVWVHHSPETLLPYTHSPHHGPVHVDRCDPLIDKGEPEEIWWLRFEKEAAYDGEISGDG